MLCIEFFTGELEEKYSSYNRDVAKSRNKELKELFKHGFGIHHAGMLRSDRTLTERMFADGVIKVAFKFIYTCQCYSCAFK